MLLNKKIATFLFGSVFMSCISSAIAEQICAPRDGQVMTRLTVYDGAPEELASLIADQTKGNKGYWELSTVYNAGRFVTIRCVYSDNKTVDVKLVDRVSRCSFKIGAKGAVTLNCQ